MPSIHLKNITVDDLEKDLKIDDSGELYWKGKRIRRGNIPWFAIISIIIASLVAISQWLKFLN